MPDDGTGFPLTMENGNETDTHSAPPAPRGTSPVPRGEPVTARGETVTEDSVSCSIFVIKPRGVGFGRRSSLRPLQLLKSIQVLNR